MKTRHTLRGALFAFALCTTLLFATITLPLEVNAQSSTFSQKRLPARQRSSWRRILIAQA